MDDVLKHEFNMPPSNATCWMTRGNFGSAVFDMGEFSGEFLEISICDGCLTAGKERVFRVVPTSNPREPEVKIFNPKD